MATPDAQSWARSAASTRRSQGTARTSGRETSSMALTSIDSHKVWPFPDRHG